MQIEYNPPNHNTHSTNKKEASITGIDLISLTRQTLSHRQPQSVSISYTRTKATIVALGTTIEKMVKGPRARSHESMHLSESLIELTVDVRKK